MHIFNSNLNLDAKLVKGEGPFLFNSDGDRFFDCWLGSGTLIFGHEKVI
jgi:acetylornithine/succinyldiaminopimelate/putrescine aminotransferase